MVGDTRLNNELIPLPADGIHRQSRFTLPVQTSGEEPHIATVFACLLFGAVMLKGTSSA